MFSYVSITLTSIHANLRSLSWWFSVEFVCEVWYWRDRVVWETHLDKQKWVGNLCRFQANYGGFVHRKLKFRLYSYSNLETALEWYNFSVPTSGANSCLNVLVSSDRAGSWTESSYCSSTTDALSSYQRMI